MPRTEALVVALGSLLELGYFPRELPPPFTTKTFAAWAPANAKLWPEWPKASPWTQCAQHNLARPGGLRRPLKVPNPVGFFPLALLVAERWEELVAHTSLAEMSASRPSLRKGITRAIVPRYRYAELGRLKLRSRRAARYLLRTDINQFYPTLYTHSVPWALHTKPVAKAALHEPGKGKALLGNRLDTALRGMQDGQSIGIPIGPDTSLLVAEVVLAAIDLELEARFGGRFRGFRYVDDYELAFSSLTDAEEVLTYLQGALATHGLILNPRKTRIVTLPAALDQGWASTLMRFILRDRAHPVGQRNDIQALFGQALEIASRFPEESVLKYAVHRVRGEDVDPKGWASVQNCLLNAASADPSTLPAVFGVLFEVSERGGHKVARAPLSEVLEAIIERHAPRAQGSEVAWALWAALAWEVDLGHGAATALGAMEDDIVALLALDANQRGRFPAGGLSLDRWRSLTADPGVTASEHWLLAYEAHRHGWLNCPALGADVLLSAMMKGGVVFYDESLNTPQVPLAAGPIPGGDLPDHY